jgi:hypothetical protein
MDTVLATFERRTYPGAKPEVLLWHPRDQIPMMAGDRAEAMAYGRCPRMDNGTRCAYVLRLGRDKAAPAVDRLWERTMAEVGERSVCRVQMTEAEIATISV